ncbi:SRPBCC family protein [Euzebya tangerina]|uniref:SRPBCC family protein n=1 Tax=Euzebya tangerina TaxID=591198 RepID=UPI000E310117|nr:SRPBCC family protein [Euzebya tangerina]
MVRFSDGPTTEVSRVIAAEPADIWPLVTDVLLPVQGSPELQHVEWEDPHTRIAPEAVFIGHNARGDARWQTRCVVTHCDPEGAYSYTAWAGDEAVATWTFELEPTDRGTRVTQRVLLGPGRSGLTWAIKQRPDDEEAIIDRRLAQLATSMEHNLDAIEARATS